jgi:hypothetical protein
MLTQSITFGITLAAGLLLLTTGRKLIWLVIGLAGFIGGLVLSQRFVDQPTTWIIIGSGLAGGVLALILVGLIKNLTLGVGGFFLGAFLANGLLTMLKLDLGVLNWVVMGLAGALVAFILLSAFEFALKLVTSFAGAMLLVQLLPEDFAYTRIVIIILVITGIIVQSRKKKALAQDPSE